MISENNDHVAKWIENKLRQDFPGLEISIHSVLNGYAYNFGNTIPSKEDKEAVCRKVREYAGEINKDASDNPFWEVNPNKASSEYHLELVDPTGWHSATVKWDGCVNLWKYHNVPLQSRTGLPQDEHREIVDYIHYCRIDDEIERLQLLKKMAVGYFATHGPGG